MSAVSNDSGRGIPRSFASSDSFQVHGFGQRPHENEGVILSGLVENDPLPLMEEMDQYKALPRLPPRI